MLVDIPSVIFSDSVRHKPRAAAVPDSGSTSALLLLAVATLFRRQSFPLSSLSLTSSSLAVSATARRMFPIPFSGRPFPMCGINSIPDNFNHCALIVTASVLYHTIEIGGTAGA